MEREFSDGPHAARRPLDGLGVVHVQAEEDDRRVAGHFQVGGLADGFHIGQAPLRTDVADHDGDGGIGSAPYARRV